MTPFMKVLDYGCGRGFDADTLGFSKYDPYWGFFADDENQINYEAITCIYVLNVVTKEVQQEILRQVKALLIPGGSAYFAVRRDLKGDVQIKDHVQRIVKLPTLRLIHEDSKFAIYKMIRNAQMCARS